MGLMKKLKNRYFLILKFCFHEVTLEAGIGRWACDVDIVDSALEMMGIALFKCNIIGSSVHITNAETTLFTVIF